MAHEVRLSFADPDVRSVECGDGLWVFAAVRPDAIRRLIRESPSTAAVREGLTEVAEDAVVVRVASDRRGTVDGFRSATATRNLYFLRSTDGATVLTDNFRTAISHLDPSDRAVERSAAVDHLLFRAPIEPDTYVAGIRALPQGEWVHWDGDAGEWSRRFVDPLTAATSTPPSGATEQIDEALSSSLDAGASTDAGVMLSGGVDSTLLSTYLDGPSALVMGVDSPEYAFEREYAERALSMLDTDGVQRVTVSEDDFLDHLEASVDALGFPSHYNQTVVTDAAFRSASDGRYVNGEGADALFGLTGVKGCRVADWFDPVLSPLLSDHLPSFVPDAVADQYRTLTHLARRLDRSLDAPDSFANQFAFFTDPSAVADLFDARLVAARFRRQAAYVRRRVSLPDGGRFARQAAFAHLLGFFRHNTVAQWRQLGHAHGQRVFAPFKTRRLARCALSIPASRRYVQGVRSLGSLTTKHHLKSLLADRLPPYPVTQAKGAGSLPVERYFEDGPLERVFERYDPPSFVPESAYDRHVHSFGPVTWNLVTFAIWRDRVLRNPSVEPVSSTTPWIRRVTTEPPPP